MLGFRLAALASIIYCRLTRPAKQDAASGALAGNVRRLKRMSAYSFINGIIYFDDRIDGDIEKDLSEGCFSDVTVRTIPNDRILFSFGIKECRMEQFFNLMEKWSL